MTNCPNCGAIVIGDVCEYCGTRFKKKAVVMPRRSEPIELEATPLGEETYIRVPWVEVDVSEHARFIYKSSADDFPIGIEKLIGVRSIDPFLKTVESNRELSSEEMERYKLEFRGFRF